jgi:hypothetical protein
MAALHGWRVPEDSPEIRGEARAVGGRFDRRREGAPTAGQATRARRFDGRQGGMGIPVSGGGFQMVGAHRGRRRRGVADRRRRRGKFGSRGEDWGGGGAAETTERIQRNCACVPLLCGRRETCDAVGCIGNNGQGVVGRLLLAQPSDSVTSLL